MKKKTTEQDRAVAAVKAKISPRVPCINADEDGYCTGPCEGSLCFKCAEYRPQQADCTAAAPALPHADNVTALTVQLTALPIPEGSPAEQANALHCDFLRHAVTSKLRAIQCGWVLALQRERLGHGQWMPWVADNLDFTLRTVQNYLVAFHTTVGAYRAQMRRPLPLSVEPTVKEITAAAAYAAERQGESNAKERPLAALYRETGVVEGNQNWGGKGRGQGRKPRDAEAEAEAAETASSAAVRAELSAEEGRGLVAKLAGWALGADDGFGTLPDGELARAVKTLKQVLERAEEIKSAREGAR